VAAFGASGRIEAVQVAMLGPLEVRTGPDPASGDVVEVGGARLRALLIMLALQPGRLVTSGQLIDGLWADDSPAGAANALQALVSRLRRACPRRRSSPGRPDTSSGSTRGARTWSGSRNWRPRAARS
jgi:DNA-binding SARP family transcriptional activator